MKIEKTKLLLDPDKRSVDSLIIKPHDVLKKPYPEVAAHRAQVMSPNLGVIVLYSLCGKD